MDREQFLEYVDHFNNHRWDKVTSYFRPDVVLEYPDSFGDPTSTARTLHGPQEFINNYKAITANVREVLNLGAFMSEGNQFFVELITEFHVFRDAPEGSRAIGKIGKKGEVIVMNQCVLYDTDEEGKFQQIRIFHHRYLDPASIQH